MCLLSYFTPGAPLVREDLETGCLNNPDGFGYAMIVAGEIVTGHSMDYTIALGEFAELRGQYPDTHALFHSRITTDGVSNESNCHPFRVSGRSDMVLAHNGVLMNCRPRIGDLRSDTRILAEEIMGVRFLAMDRRKTRRKFENWMGSSKVVVLTTDPAYERQAYIFNERLGSWVQGVWHSNDSYLPYRWSYVSATALNWPREPGPSALRDTISSAWWYQCIDCGLEEGDCLCSFPTMHAVSRSNTGTIGVEDVNDPETWICKGCGAVGWINDDSGECSVCQFMWCCDSLPSECQCYAGFKG